MTAVMADQLPVPMRRQRYIAMRTFYYISARPARNKSGIPPPVKKKHDLFMPLKPRFYQVFQAVADDRTIPRLHLLTHIHHIDRRKFPCSSPFPQFKDLKTSVLAGIEGLKRRCRRSQHNAGILRPGPSDGRLSGMIPRHLLALIRSLVLLVDDDQPQTRKRGKQRGTRADHHIHLTGLHPFHLIVTLPLRHSGIEYGHAVAEPSVESHDRLICKCDLWDQDDRLSALIQHSCDHLHIDFCLPASRHTIDQIGPPDSLTVVFPETIDRMLLFPGIFRYLLPAALMPDRVPKDLL